MSSDSICFCCLNTGHLLAPPSLHQDNTGQLLALSLHVGMVAHSLWVWLCWLGCCHHLYIEITNVGCCSWLWWNSSICYSRYWEWLIVRQQESARCCLWAYLAERVHIPLTRVERLPLKARRFNKLDTVQKNSSYTVQHDVIRQLNIHCTVQRQLNIHCTVQRQLNIHCTVHLRW